MIVKAREIFKEGGREHLFAELLDGNILKLTYTRIVEDAENSVLEKEIALADVFSPFYTTSVFLNTEATEITDPIKIKLSRDTDTLFKEVNDLGTNLCSLYFNNTIEEFVLLARIPVNMECELYKGQPFAAIADSYPEWLEHYKIMKERKRILSELDCNEALAGLEAQVDYLTLLVKQVLDENTDLKKKLINSYPNMDEFFKVCGAENLLVIKPEDKIFREIKSRKGFIRTAQTNFYNAIGGGYNYYEI